MRDRDRPLDVYGPPGLTRALQPGAAARDRAHEVPAGRDRARAPRGGPLGRLRDRLVPGQPPRRGLRLRVHRARPPGALRRRGGARPRRHRRARTSGACSAARPSTASRPSRSSGRTGRGAGSSTRGDTAPVQSVEVYAAPRRPARPRGDVLRGRARPRARDRPLDRRPGRPHGQGRRRQAARADAPLHALLPARDPRRGARRSSRTRSSRATSTRSRCRSRSAASRSSSRAELDAAPS